MSFTFIFGSYSAFILTKTKSIFSCFTLHSFCNLMGFPNIAEVFEMHSDDKKSKFFRNFIKFLIYFRNSFHIYNWCNLIFYILFYYLIK